MSISLLRASKRRILSEIILYGIISLVLILVVYLVLSPHTRSLRTGASPTTTVYILPYTYSALQNSEFTTEVRIAPAADPVSEVQLFINFPAANISWISFDDTGTAFPTSVVTSAVGSQIVINKKAVTAVTEDSLITTIHWSAHAVSIDNPISIVPPSKVLGVTGQDIIFSNADSAITVIASTITPTETSIVTATNTPSPSPTATSTPTITQTSTPTPTKTPTPTLTPVSTSTSTVAPTNTLFPTETAFIISPTPVSIAALNSPVPIQQPTSTQSSQTKKGTFFEKIWETFIIDLRKFLDWTIK